ncbi:hypothetical protein BDM02DRAFT_3192722, partial [Thelephora ganbajun]
MVEVAADPTDKVLAAKLRITCTFHTPLMEAQENVFKDFVKGVLTATREPIAKVMSTVELGTENMSLEITPHPVLKSYIEEISGNPISLIHRPNPKAPAQNTGEHFQFLEGIGDLLMIGYKHID